MLLEDGSFAVLLARKMGEGLKNSAFPMLVWLRFTSRVRTAGPHSFLGPDFLSQQVWGGT